MEPTKYLEQPYPYPPNSSRATTVQQMFKLQPAFVKKPNYEYFVGIPYANAPFTHIFTNKTLNADLDITLSLPNFLKSNVSSIRVRPNTSVEIKIALNETEVRKLTAQRLNAYEGSIELKVKPVNYTGPVLISTQSTQEGIRIGEPTRSEPTDEIRR